jgi:signal transduction histidine kinase
MATAAALVAMLIAVLVLFGWWSENSLLMRLRPGMTAMNPLTAVCLIFAGASLALQIHENRPALVRRLARGLAVLVLVLGLGKLACYATGWVFPIDPLGWDEPGIVGEMATKTALSLIFLGTSLLFFDRTTKSGSRPAEIMAMGVALIAILTLAIYAYQIQRPGVGDRNIPMALNTAVALLILAVGVVFARPRCGLMAVAVGDGPGGWLVLRMSLAMVMVFVVVGGLLRIGEALELDETGPAVAIYTVVSFGIYGVFLLESARSLHRMDAVRRRHEAEILQLNTELRVQKDRLEWLNQELELFADSVSHDLRAPLRGICGFTRALEHHAGAALDPTGLGYLKRVRAAAGRMDRLIDDLLDLSRTTRAEMTVNPVDLSALATGLVAGYRQADPERVVEVVIEPGIRVAGDRALLRVLLDNLIANAWKFSSKTAAAVIEVGSAVAPDGRVRCFVRDNGVGFDNRHAGKLFGAFQRLHSPADFPGTGIGLVTVQRIIHRHGGEVTARGEINHGATFEFTLDAMPQPLET